MPDGCGHGRSKNSFENGASDTCDRQASFLSRHFFQLLLRFTSRRLASCTYSVALLNSVLCIAFHRCNWLHSSFTMKTCAPCSCAISCSCMAYAKIISPITAYRDRAREPGNGGRACTEKTLFLALSLMWPPPPRGDAIAMQIALPYKPLRPCASPVVLTSLCRVLWWIAFRYSRSSHVVSWVRVRRSPFLLCHHVYPSYRSFLSSPGCISPF